MEEKTQLRKMKPVTEEEWSKVNPVNRKIVAEFLEQGHLSVETLKQYKSALFLFFRWVMEECDNKPVNKLRPKDAIRFQNYMLGLGLSPNAVKFKRSSISSLMVYIETFYLEEDGFENFRNIYNKKVPNPAKELIRKKEPITIEEFQKLITELEKRGEWQMIAYLKFSFATGCRRAESIQLLKEVVNYEKLPEKEYYQSHEVRGKGRGKVGKRFKLYYNQETQDAIKKWLEVRGEDDCPYVFVSRHSDGTVTQLSKTTLNYWCSDIFSVILNRRVHPHGIRMSKATSEAINGKSVEAIQRLLNHSDPSTTALYIVKDGDSSLDEIFSG